MKIATLIGLIFWLSSCAQSKNIVVKKYAFYTVLIPGNIPVDENNNPIHNVDTSVVVYVETKEKDIVWTRAFINGKEKKVIPFLLKDTAVIAGYDRVTQQPIRISTKGKYLWRLSFSNLVEGTSGQNHKVKQGVFLQGSQGTKTLR